ncbi:hypothetical protein [Methylophilus sp. 5]|uniref:hypothetical protein n=1 Tax=Methylophilus sp. 5 TaxID=1112274 RepID=UPI00048BFC3A|nr:hypothetical protein [Methylophilus sp. 5]
MNINQWVYASLAIFGMSSHAQAMPTGSLVFNEPTGIVGANDVVEVSLKFTLDASSERMDYLDLSDAPADWLSVTNKIYTTGYRCSTDTFTGGCGFSTGTPYAANFVDTADGYEKIQTLVLEPGASVDFLGLTYTPNGSPVPSGTYSLFQFSVLENLIGTKLQQQFDADGNLILDLDGNPLLVEAAVETGYQVVAQTCADEFGVGCSGNQIFTRTVSAVAEPEVYAMWLASMGLLGLMRRRQWFV